MMRYSDGYRHDFGGDGFSMLHAIGPVLMLAFWAAVIYGIIVFARSLSRGAACGHGHDRDRAMDILKERYAKGDVSREEFEQKKKDLA